MGSLLRALYGVLIVVTCSLAGCIEPNNVRCGDILCPSGKICDGLGGCAFPDQLEVCANQADRTPCSYAGTPNGECTSGLCLPPDHCGDGVVDSIEACDDGNSINEDGCHNNCQLPRCGDGVLDSGEQCDDGDALNALLPDARCRPSCVLAGCGDGVVDVLHRETCDNGVQNADQANACRTDCEVPRCGDGIEDTGEVCDDGDQDPADGCSADCLSDETCGNAFIDVLAGEVCDDGNMVSGDGCRSDCRSREVCGDGAVDGGEICDDSNTTPGDGCSGDCRSNETCGNGYIDTVEGEQCDLAAGNSQNPNAACRTNCKVLRCGDGVFDNLHLEQCDNGMLNSNMPDQCRPTCQLPRCGDGVQDSGEVCDDGNTSSGDGCSADCNSLEVCNNGIVDVVVGEQCDMGAANSNAPNSPCRTSCRFPSCGDGVADTSFGESCDLGLANSNQPNAACRLNCQPQRCADAILDNTKGEICDDGNAVSGDNCSADCKSLEICGNGITDVVRNEQCDAGPANSTAANAPCRPTCVLPSCGDGAIDTVRGEACDAGGANSTSPNAACRPNCQPGRCGDNIIDPVRLEVCDDGNAISGDNCSADCKSNEQCGNGITDIAKGEECDDMNMSQTDFCHNDCKLPRCGDGLVDFNEQCDAGTALNQNTPNAPCRPNCLLPRCGDIVVDNQRGEVCDDGNSVAGDGCSIDCVSNETCGNGITDVATGEQCDDLNNRGRDGCSLCRSEDAVVLQPGQTPIARASHAMAYDAGRQRIVMFGGERGPTRQMNDTWEWDGVSWTQMHPRNSPAVRSQAGLAYDAARHRIVLYGGFSNNAYRGDTWEYDGIDWVEKTPAFGNPVPRANMAMAFDANRGRVIMNGGSTASGATNQTFEWTGTQWLALAASPTTRTGHRMAFDAPNNRMVVTGGTVSPNNTWLFTGTNWVDPGVAAPFSASELAVAFDADRGRVVVFDRNNATYEWTGVSWQLDASASPANRTRAAMAYDAVRKQLVLFGGCCTYMQDTWLRTGNTWSQPAPWLEPLERSRTAAAYDPLYRRVLMFGGVGAGPEFVDTWEWNGRSWAVISMPIPPGSRAGHTLEYNKLTRQVMMYGGIVSGAPVHTILAFDNVNNVWTQPSSSGRPATRLAAAAFDTRFNRLLTFGGRVDGPNQPTDELWSWTGAGWSLLPPQGTPPPRARHNAGMAFDQVRGVPVVFGGVTFGGNLASDVWEYDGLNWIAFPTQLGPSPRKGFEMGFNPDAGRVYVYGNADVSEDLWEWTGRAWVQRVLDTSIGARYRAAVAYDAASRAFVTFGGRDSNRNPTATTRIIQYRSRTTVEACTAANLDYDNDGLAGCSDQECWAVCQPLCPPGAPCIPDDPRCGDNVCNTRLEDCRICPTDCGSCAGRCGDFVCNPGEDDTNCLHDCGP